MDQSNVSDVSIQAAEEIFATIGRYVITFQWIEGKVDECILLLSGLENWQATQKKLSKWKNAEKLDKLQELFKTSVANARGRTRADWVLHFEAVIGRLHGERKRRNRLLHSQYLFDLLQFGGPVVQSDRVGGAAGFERTQLSYEAQQVMLAEVNKLASDIGFVHLQLVHDYNAPIASERDMDAT